MRTIAIIVMWVLGAIGLAGVACAQGVPDYGYQWSTITHAGNRYPTQAEAPEWYLPTTSPPSVRGQVNYEYRVAQTNVTNAEFVRFLNAYKPFMRPSDYLNSTFAYGTWIEYDRTAGTFYVTSPNYNRVAAESIAWLMAARYTNWLHNGEALNAEAFEYGAYDLHGITDLVQGRWDRAPQRLPGARVWIPSFDELVKATYYDPNRYGLGQEGYWPYPYGSTSQPIYNYPENGGQSDGGIPSAIYRSLRREEVDAYAIGRTPWGLYGMSGGVGDYTDTFPANTLSSGEWLVAQIRKGNGRGPVGPSVDRIDRSWNYNLASSLGLGFRLASPVPPPTALLTLAASGTLLILKRRRMR